MAAAGGSAPNITLLSTEELLTINAELSKILNIKIADLDAKFPLREYNAKFKSSGLYCEQLNTIRATMIDGIQTYCLNFPSESVTYDLSLDSLTTEHQLKITVNQITTIEKNESKERCFHCATALKKITKALGGRFETVLIPEGDLKTLIETSSDEI